MQTTMRYFLIAAVLAAALSACGPPSDTIILVTATPPGGMPGVLPAQIGGGDVAAEPNGVPAGTLDPTHAPTPTFIPTPNPTRIAVHSTTEDQVHIVQAGDTIGLIAQRYGVSLQSIVDSNNLGDENAIIYPNQALIIPQSVQATGPAFKIIPDSELVYGPALQGFNVAGYLANRNSYLGIYSEELDGRLWSGAEIIDRVALEQSVSPRLLLALIEYESQWISQPMIDPDAAAYPMGYRERPSQIYGLYRQLDWAAKMLNTGYYGWRQRGLTAALLADGTRVALDPTVNAGTAGVQVLLAQTRTLEEWQLAVHHTGLFATFASMFGDPFQYAVEPLLPPDLAQPPMAFPWGADETWYFTGGPHGGWGSGSAWAALDFVSGEEINGCEPASQYATAVADGVIARSEWGIVVLDLDGDGFEGTGWTVFYLHLSSEDRRVEEGQTVRRGDPIGHPSCEGGVSWATHLHIGRRYNGEWMAADCTNCLLDAPAPQFSVNEWLAYTFESEYDGALVKGEGYREACTCREPINTIRGRD